MHRSEMPAQRHAAREQPRQDEVKSFPQGSGTCTVSQKDRGEEGVKRREEKERKKRRFPLS